MNWRVILRFSLDGDKNSALRNAIEKRLVIQPWNGGTNYGLTRTTTGTWESPALPVAVAQQLLTDALNLLTAPSSVNGIDPGAMLDHFWLYIDRA
jgi:hypothetical protein